MPVAYLYQSPTKQIKRVPGNRWGVYGRHETVGYRAIPDRLITKRQLASELANGEAWQEFREYRPSEKLELAQKQDGIEVFYVDRSTARLNRAEAERSGSRAVDGERCERAGWYWWSCLPGCLPSGSPFGPFGTKHGALLDIYENVVKEKP